MTAKTEGANTRSKFLRLTCAFSIVYSLAILVLLVEFVLPPKIRESMAGPHISKPFLYGFIGMVVMVLLVTGFAAQMGLRRLSTGAASGSWPGTHFGLLVTIAAFSMIPLLVTVVWYLLVGNAIPGGSIWFGFMPILFNYHRLSRGIANAARADGNTRTASHKS